MKILRLVLPGLFALLSGCDNAPATSTLAGTAPGPAGDEVPFAPTPDPDAFYAQPDPLPAVAPGTVLNSRETTFQPAGVPQPNPAWLIQYMTRDVNDRPIAATAVVVKPMIPALLGDSPLVSYQFAYDSLGAPCAPSRTVTGDTSNNNSTAETLVYIAGLQTQGWTMVFPDYEGPYHAYGAGKLSGQATLDGIRAALSFEPLGLSATATPIGMMGYSGGALATAWAATLHPTYAPELNLVGVVSGGTPADVFGVVQAAENSTFFGLILSAIVGTNRAYPELLPDSILNDKGRQTFEALKDGCVGETSDGSSPSGALADYTNVADPYQTPGALSVKPKVTLPQPGMSPTANLYIYHEMLDELIPIAGTDAMVDAWCAAGTPLSYFRSVTGEHISGVAAGTPAALAYLIGRFNGTPQNLVLPAPITRVCNQ